MVAEGGEGENPLPFSLTAPKRGGGGGGGGGVGGVSRLRFPPGPHLRSSRFSRHPRLRQAPTRCVFVGKRPQAPGRPKPWGPGPQAPWRPGPQAPGAWIPPLSPVDFLQPSLTSCCVKTMGPGLKTLGCYHNPQSVALDGFRKATVQ